MIKAGVKPELTFSKGVNHEEDKFIPVDNSEYSNFGITSRN
jgi:hypothetical protein